MVLCLVPASLAALGRRLALVVGPDGYPDSIMGQGDNPETTIDEGSAGDRMAHVLNKAWNATSRSRYPAGRAPSVIEFFFDLRNDLNAKAGTNSNWEDLLNDFQELEAKWNRFLVECPALTLECAEATADLIAEGFDIAVPDEMFAATVKEIVVPTCGRGSMTLTMNSATG